MSCRLRIRVVPNAPRSRYVGVMDDGVTHKIKVNAQPIDGKGHKVLLLFLARKLGVPKDSVTLSVGARSRNKVVKIEGLKIEAVHRQLSEA